MKSHEHYKNLNYFLIIISRLPVCKEFVDGLRICFDFALPLILLYDEERSQFDRITNMYKNKSPIKSKE